LAFKSIIETLAIFSPVLAPSEASRRNAV